MGAEIIKISLKEALGREDAGNVRRGQGWREAVGWADAVSVEACTECRKVG